MKSSGALMSAAVQMQALSFELHFQILALRPCMPGVTGSLWLPHVLLRLCPGCSIRHRPACPLPLGVRLLRSP